MAYLSDTARLVLEAAAERNNLSVLPFPETVKAKGGAMQKVLTGLRNRGFVRVVQSDPQRVLITSEGMAAIGAVADDEPPAEPETGPTAVDEEGTDETPAPAAEADTAAEPARGEPEATAGGTAKPAIRPGTKQALLIDLLKRPEGATVEQIAARTQWQKHYADARIMPM